MAAFDPSKAKNEMPPSDLSDTQNMVLAIISVPIAALSVCASTTLIFMVLSSSSSHNNKAKKRRLNNTNTTSTTTATSSLDRILICMSVYDILWSIQACLQGFLAPPDVSQRVTAWGNATSCHALGFLFQLGGAVFWYNGMLSLYFMVTIVYGWTERRFVRIAPYLHATAFLYNGITAVWGLIAGWYDSVDLGSGCWISHYPTGCRGDECRSDEIAWIVAGYPTVVMIAFVVTCNVLIYRHVRTTMERSLRHSVRHVVVGTASTETNNNSQSQRSIRQVAIQCFLYVLAFWCTITPWIVIRALDGVDYLASNESKIFPLLGYPSKSRLWALRRTILGSSNDDDQEGVVVHSQHNGHNTNNATAPPMNPIVGRPADKNEAPTSESAGKAIPLEKQQQVEECGGGSAHLVVELLSGPTTEREIIDISTGTAKEESLQVND